MVIVKKKTKSRKAKTVPMTEELINRMAQFPVINWCEVMRASVIDLLSTLEGTDKKTKKRRK